MLIDFTADWCGICKTNEFVALNRWQTRQFLTSHEIEFMIADFTEEDPEIRKWLNTFQQENVPLTVIIPPGKDSKVIALRGAYTKEMLLSKLRQAFGEESATEATAAIPHGVRPAALTP
jgi:thiol:disulfide interchange protein DsbD